MQLKYNFVEALSRGSLSLAVRSFSSLALSRVKGILKANRDRHGDDIIGDLKKSEEGGAKMDEDAPAAPAAKAEGAAAEKAMEQDDDEAALQAALQLSMGNADSGGMRAHHFTS